MSPDLQITSSPNHDARAHDEIDTIVLHYTGMTTGAAAVARLCDPVAKVSSHYVVHEDGGIVQLVSEQRRAWHAGVSLWHKATDINSRSIGIEIVNPGHDAGYPDFPAAQIDAVIRLCRDIIARYPVPPDRVLAHSDIAPDRKRDPGEKFPWRQLYENGVGLWVVPEPLQIAEDTPKRRSEVLNDLRTYGYGAPKVDGKGASAVIAAFQRHFRPERVDGVADISTAVTLRRLLKAQRSQLKDISPF
jgi:N-acetylmuramoyl-L-alanine amidase